jgi:hypothetical protein
MAGLAMDHFVRKDACLKKKKAFGGVPKTSLSHQHAIVSLGQICSFSSSFPATKCFVRKHQDFFTGERREG